MQWSTRVIARVNVNWKKKFNLCIFAMSKQIVAISAYPFIIITTTSLTNAVCLDDLDLVYHPLSFSLSLSSVLANKPSCVHKSLKGFFNRSGLLKFQDNSWIVDEGLDLNSLNNFDYYLLRNDNKYVLVLVNQPLATCFEIPFSNISPLPPFLISWNLVALLIK